MSPKLLEKSITFRDDIEDIIKALSIGVQSAKHLDYIIQDTDQWEDLLLIGTEVSGSCQRISGDASVNKCLVGYLADGKNRAIVAKDKNGKNSGSTHDASAFR